MNCANKKYYLYIFLQYSCNYKQKMFIFATVLQI